MRFVTHSRYEAILPRVVDQDNTDHAGAKPNGIWFSVIGEDGKDGWVERRQKDGEEPEPYRHELTFKSEARILWLRNAEDIDAFNARFGNYSDPSVWAASPGRRRSAIRWEEVARQYDALIAIPYCEGRAPDHWYGTFEFASGCVWNLDLVETVSLS